MKNLIVTRLGYSFLALLAVVILISGCASLGERGAHQQQARELFGEAMAAIDAGELEDSLAHLVQLRDDYRNTPHGRQAALEKAYVSYRLGRYEETIELVRQYADERPDAASEDVAYALFLRAAAAHARWDEEGTPPNTDYARQAFAFYRQLVERFPEGERVEDALRQMNSLRADLAAEELRKAQLKMDEGDFVQAAERAAWVAEQYPGQQEAADALALQAEALENLGRPREAEATRRMLQIKHPEHPAAN
ncbi:outer membrane protein assembly factor BamD [Halorhodospira halochloris]|uniref:outer membrane protein assembly factor BamD n=1 Tax=Halorhodospira halochloris TaxID=1052 RepID=UPI001EE86A2E|nr:outer membrane protein assembly factor BamD [Halorhodospira halochloris]MCG5547260.1 outer membrane protein assembly factor BamD [Halorhodospira halochloris]